VADDVERGFFSGGRWAVVGVSHSNDKFGSIVHRRLKKRGEQVYAVNPTLGEVEGERCYPTLADLPEQVDQIVVVVPPRETERVVEEAVERGVTRVWMQPGAESPAAVEYCRARGVDVIAGRCILRYMDQMDTRGEQ
jgi:predicted CoA-binding protein